MHLIEQVQRKTATEGPGRSRKEKSSCSSTDSIALYLFSSQAPRRGMRAVGPAVMDLRISFPITFGTGSLLPLPGRQRVSPKNEMPFQRVPVIATAIALSEE